MKKHYGLGEEKETDGDSNNSSGGLKAATAYYEISFFPFDK